MSSRRRRAQNALQRCPGYEPNPMFLFLERCKNCGFVKAEHSKSLVREDSMFSYIGVDDRLGAPKNVADPKVQRFLPSGSGDRPNFKLPVTKMEAAPSLHSPKDTTKDVISNRPKKKSVEQTMTIPQPIVREERHLTKEEETESKGPIARVNSPEEIPTIQIKPEQPEAPEPEKSEPPKITTNSPDIGVTPRSRVPSRDPKQLVSAPEPNTPLSQDGETSDKEEDEDEEDVPPLREPKPLQPNTPQRKSTLKPKGRKVYKGSLTKHDLRRPESGKTSVQKSKSVKASNKSQSFHKSSFHSSRASSTMGMLHRSSRLLRPKVPKIRGQSMKSILSDKSALQGESPEEMDTSRKAHLDQIRFLLKMTKNADAKTRLNHSRVYEEPSLATLDLYRAQGGNLIWKKKMLIGWSKLHVAAWNRDARALRKLLRSKRLNDPNGVTNDGDESPLSIAVKRGSLECVELLVKRGADLDACDIFGYTPLHYAVRLDREDIVSFLLEQQANCDVTTDDVGLSLLHIGARFASVPVIKLLLSKSLDVNALDKRMWIPLNYAVMRHDGLDVVTLLIKNGSALNNTDMLKVSLLHCATVSDSPEIAEPLVENGCRMDAKDESGWNALHYCARYDARAFLQTLLEYGAHPSPSDPADIAPYDVAVFFKHQEIMNQLKQASGFKEPLGDRRWLDCESSSLSRQVRLDEELDLAELTNLRGVLAYSTNTAAKDRMCVIS